MCKIRESEAPNFAIRMGYLSGAEGSPLLDNIETSNQIDKRESKWQELIQKSSKENKEIAKALCKLRYNSKEEKEKWLKKAHHLENCNVSKSLYIVEDRFIELGNKCKYRVCILCSKVKQMHYYTQFFEFLKTKKIARKINHDGLRLLTLTIKNQKNLLSGIDKLYKSFHKFIRRKYLIEIITKKGVKKKRIRGGLGSFHIKKDEKGLYNHHIHFIIDSSYLDMKSHKKTGKDSKLVQEWKTCTGDRGILDVRKIKDHRGALNYVLQYITGGLKDLTPKEKAIFFKATSGRRLLFTFGSFYGVPKPKKKSKYQYVSPHSQEYNLYLISKNPKKKPLTLEDYEKGVY